MDRFQEENLTAIKDCAICEDTICQGQLVVSCLCGHDVCNDCAGKCDYCDTVICKGCRVKNEDGRFCPENDCYLKWLRKEKEKLETEQLAAEIAYKAKQNELGGYIDDINKKIETLGV